MVRFERNVLARVNPRNREIRRRTRMVGSFPDERSALMLVCARVRYVTSNEWSTRRYLDMSRLGETVREANRSSPQGRAKTKVRKSSGTTKKYPKSPTNIRLLPHNLRVEAHESHFHKVNLHISHRTKG